MLKVNSVPLGPSPRVRRRAVYRRTRKRKPRPEAGLHWGYNYSRGHIPRVPGAGRVQIGLFEQPGGSAPRLPRRHLGTVLALFGAVIFLASFLLLLHPWGFAVWGGLLLVFVLRGFFRSAA
jgi:hypothetical protein